MLKFNSDWFEQESKSRKYDLVVAEVFGNDVLLKYHSPTISQYNTPRESALTPKKFSMIPLWYLDFLASEKPTKIVDIGCGANLFKPLIKKIYNIDCYGIDPTPGNPAADEFNFFDSDFSQGHTEFYQSVFSINALHFVPLFEFSTVVGLFHNIVAKGGRCFLALNSCRMLECTSTQWLLNTFGKKIPDSLQVQEYVLEQLSILNIDFLVTDVLITECADEWMDGNIRMVFKK
jgi:SAM-dependent methyltransferase